MDAEFGEGEHDAGEDVDDDLVVNGGKHLERRGIRKFGGHLAIIPVD